MKNKKMILILLIAILISGIITFFVKNNYKKINSGNNINNKTLEECEEYIFNINSYEATAEITVQSNKNTNKYVVKQKSIGQYNLQEVIEPANIKGLKMEYNNGILTIENTELDLKKVYSDYPYIAENTMFLNDFISQYKTAKEANNTSIKEEDNYVVFQINTENKYKKTEQLYINEDTGYPEKLVVQDNNQKDTAYILYNEIKLNCLS